MRQFEASGPTISDSVSPCGTMVETFSIESGCGRAITMMGGTACTSDVLRCACWKGSISHGGAMIIPVASFFQSSRMAIKPLDPVAPRKAREAFETYVDALE